MQDVDPGWLQRGERIGSYEVVARIASGGFGAVYRVVRDGRSYALKIAAKNILELPDDERRRFEERVEREVVALMSLRHPNVVRVHAYDRWPDTDGFQYVVMDFVDGLRLGDWCAQQTPSLTRILEVFRKVALALAEVHRLEIFHRDLKQDNVMIRLADGEPFLVDFGISRPRSAVTVTREMSLFGTFTHFSPEYCAFFGSSAYMAGELFRDFTPATELWAFGVMLYEALAGRLPFDVSVSDMVGYMAAVTNEAPATPTAINPQVPAEVSAVVMRLLEKRPEDRYQSAKTVADVLAGLIEGAPATWAGPLDVPLRPVRRVRSSRSASAVASSTPPSWEQPPAETPQPSSPVSAAVEPSTDGVPNVQSSPVASPSPLPLPAQGFEVPSADVPSTFVAPDSVAGNPTALNPGQISTELEQLRQRLKRAAGGPSRRQWWLVGGVGLAVLAILLLASWPDDSKKERSLLSLVEAQAKDAGVEVSESLPPMDLPTQAAAPEKALGARPSSADGAQIDALLEEHYGRPTIPGPDGGAQVVRAPPSGPKWLLQGEEMEPRPEKTDAAERRFGVPLGQHISVRLRSPLDSRTLSEGVVEAMLMRPLVVRGEMRLPSRTMLYGQASTTAGRFAIRFAKLRLPDHSEASIRALALDEDDGQPGLSPSRRFATPQGASSGVAQAVAKGAASTVINSVTGGNTAAEVAKGAGHTLLAADGTPAAGISEAFQLDAGGDFVVFVEEAF